MTKDQIILLATLKDENHFNLILDSIETQYKNTPRDYDSTLTSIPFFAEKNYIPKFLYKYIDFDGGLASITNSNLQFSHPLSFRNNLSPLGDMSEFWFERFYIDKTSLNEFINELIIKYNKKISLIEAFHLLLYQEVMNTVERNKVLCLSINKNNSYLKKQYPTGICIEYKADLFEDKTNLLYEQSKYTIIYNEVKYVNEIIPYPIRFNDHNWLLNYLFIKNKYKYSKEEEFRIIFTIDYIDDYNRLNKEEKVKYFLKRLLDDDKADTNPLRIKIDRSFINHVYYDSNIKNEKKLILTLKEYGINYSKID